jgi:hypothetical protein
LYSARNRKDYKQIFELVYANKTSYLNQWEEMIKAVRKADIVQKDAFIDSYITLITKISSGKNIPHNFAAVNNEVFEYILASIDAPAVLKLIPYLEQQKQQKFLLNKYFYHTFRNSRYQTSVPHVAIAGDIENHIPGKTSQLTNDSGYVTSSNAETWTFTLADGSTVTKKVVLA